MNGFRHAATGVGAAMLCVGPGFDAHAIMRRHDVPDTEYIVSAQDHPAIVDLLEPGDCVATLIAPQWLITAAHCAAYLPAGHSIQVGPTAHTVDGVVCHPDYTGSDHDLALVRLTEAVTGVTPLLVYRNRDEVDREVLFVGRGDHGTGEQGQVEASNDGATRAATNTVVAADDTWIEFVFNRPDETEVTAREGISGDGDSGGPALIETPNGMHVVGVSSWQDADDRDIGKYGVHEFYTRASSYLEFIDETTGPDWDGVFRSCAADDEDGCRVVAPRPSDGRSLGLLALLGVVLIRRRRRPRRVR